MLYRVIISKVSIYTMDGILDDTTLNLALHIHCDGFQVPCIAELFCFKRKYKTDTLAGLEFRREAESSLSQRLTPN